MQAMDMLTKKRAEKMANFRYRYGDRPLEGYTIEHGVGRGGFGEVYYAVSDSGRQVALKAVQNYEDVELRGIGHCMNLKSPHLVTIFDVKFNADSVPFVIMEYVAGPSLRQLLDAHPDGMGTDKAAFFAREIARGLQYLHDSGVVHRDLKPHNVFYEDGLVKIGDYSLSKAITTSHRSGHTVTVGTVHYMAPEISMGRYGTEVDIYALGVMLYEMLKGVPPFVGQSMAEILMKHMSAQPDVSDIPAPFDRVIRKAMAKDPAERYQSANEMMAALFGDPAVQDSVMSLSPQTLSIVAAQALKVAPVVGTSMDTHEVQALTPATTPTEHYPQRPRAAGPATQPAAVRHPRHGSRGAAEPHPAYLAGRGVAGLGSALGIGFQQIEDGGSNVHDTMPHERRIQLALATVATMSLLCAVGVGSGSWASSFRLWVMAFTGITVGTAAIDWTRRQVMPGLPHDSKFVRRLVYVPMGLGGMMLSMFIVQGLTSLFFQEVIVARSLVWACLVPFAVLDWHQLSSSRREHRLRLFPAILAAGLAMWMSGMGDTGPAVAMGLMAGLVLSIQVLSPWSPAPVAPLRPKSPQPKSPQPTGPAAQSLQAGLAHAAAVVPGAAGEAREAGEPILASLANPPGVQGKAAARQNGQLVVSPRSRRTALLLTVIGPIFGLAGLQRLYAGRIFSGILWLVTYGIFGIGQLIDLFVVASGELRDGQGRLIVRWSGPPVSDFNATQSVASQRVTSYPGSWADQVIGLFGVVLLALACAAGMFAATRWPEGMVAVFSTQNPQQLADLNHFFGPTWPTLLIQLARFAGLCTGAIGAGLLMISRRHAPGAHVARAGFAAALVGLSCVVMSNVFEYFDWAPIGDAVAMNRFPTEQVVNLIGSGGRGPEIAFAGAMLVGSLFLLAWPRKRLAVPASPIVEPAPAELK